ncbi:MAG: gamma-glutamyltransferase family protein [Oscillospiraceae bacterium]|nr:gamma-glutamyltransferase family protein [Oscillospiraceae bacterium]
MVNCSSPMASAAGLEILRRGGNAVDAAVAAASTLAVVEPTANGLGSDAFAIVWIEKDQKLYGLNASGPAPMLASIGRIREMRLAENGKMPAHGWAPVTVPGAVGAWQALNRRFGKLTLMDDLMPAVNYAEVGYPCEPNLAQHWQAAFRAYSRELTEPCFEAWFRTFAPSGSAPEAGDMIRLPDHGASLRSIGESGGESFYRGELARKIDEESRKSSGFLRYEDLAGFEPEWVEPQHVRYRGYDVCEIPPNGQGIVALMALNILKEFSFSDRDEVDTLHRQIEALKIAFADAFHYVTDPKRMEIDPADLLLPEYGAMRAAEITEEALIRTYSRPKRSGTVYLCCADGEGNMVSYIQSNYMGFGSGIVVPGTGIALQNRGADFSLDPDHINALAPGKRSYHTIIPGFLMKDGKAVGPFGVMGAYMQPQGHLQVIMNTLDFHLNPQQALDAPRFQWLRENAVAVEARFDPKLAKALSRRGHQIRFEPEVSNFGRGQMIVRQDNGVLVGGTESRTDSNIACW